jgi:O-antigen/teichoic acid export membrane protein
VRQADRIIVNTLSNYALTFVTMVTNLVMVPVVIGQLGAGGYGLANMVLVPFGFFEVFSSVFTRALHRFIPQDHASGDPQRVGRTFSTAMMGFVALGAVGAFLVWLAFDWLLADDRVTPGTMADGRQAMWVMIAWLVVGFPTWCFRKGLEAIQRYDLIGFSHGFITLARTLLVIIVFSLKHGSVTFFVASHLAAIVASSLLCRWTLQRANPAMRFSMRLINRESIVAVGSFAAATFVGVIGEVAGSYGFRILLGKMLGLGALGAFSAIVQVQQTLCRLIDELTNAFSPAISALDASGAAVQINKLMLVGTKSSMLAASAMSVVPLAAATPFLHLWLGDAFRQYDALFLVLLLLTLVYCIGLTPAHALYGLGRVRVTGSIMFLRGVAGLLASYVYLRGFGQSLTVATALMYGVQYSGSVVMFLTACRAVGARWGMAVLEVLMRPLALAAVAGGATWVVLRQVGDERMWKLGVAVTAGELVLFALVVTLGLGEEERSRIFSFFGRAWTRAAGAVRARGSHV